MLTPRCVGFVAAISAILYGCPSNRPNTTEATTRAPNAPSTPNAASDAAADTGSQSAVRDAGASDAATCDPSRAPAPFRALACLPDSFEIRMRPLGLSKSGKYFGHCVSPCDPCGLECTLVDLTTHQRVQLRTAGEHRGDPDYQPNAAEKRATELIAREYPDGEKSPQRHFAGVFPYEDIVFATKTEPMDANGKIALLFGARVAGEDAVFPYRMTMGPHGMWQNVQARASAANMREPELAALDVLGDGKEVGVVAFARGDSWFEAADMVIVPTAVLAGRLYNESGLVAHKAKRYAPAAALFAKASSAQPSESLFAYNEACARAKAGDAQAEAALQRAIKLGGNAIKARAKKDADFDDVKSAPWFGALTR